jgi:hypothetical protein
MLSHRSLAPDVQDRALRTEGRGDAGDRIGAAGSGGGDDAAELAGLSRIAIGRVRGHLLVPDVDDADPFIDAAIIDVDDVAAAQGENRVDPLVLERLGDQVAAGDHAGVPALALQGVLGRRSFGRNRRGNYGCHVASKIMKLIARIRRRGAMRCR